MDKSKIKNIISTVVLFLICCLGFSFYGCQKDEYPFELSEGAQIYTFDSNNLLKLSQIVVEDYRLIYKFENRGNAMTPEKILELTKDKGCSIVMLGENIGYHEPFEKAEVVENGKYYYVVLYYNLDSYIDPSLQGFMINSSVKYEKYYIMHFCEPYLCFDDSYYNYVEYIQEYDEETKAWNEIRHVNKDVDYN